MVLRRGGEELFSIFEQPQTTSLAMALLGLDDEAGPQSASSRPQLVIEAVGLGDALSLDEMQVAAPSEQSTPPGAAAGAAYAQLHWHSDSPSKLSFRTAIDPQGPATPNAALRLLPGSHLRPRAEVEAELAALHPPEPPPPPPPPAREKVCYAAHPQEVLVGLDASRTLVWNPSTWHATERQPQHSGRRTPAAAQPGAPARSRRALSWNYGVRGVSRARDAEAVRCVFSEGEWRAWPEARQKLWGVWEEEEDPAAAAAAASAGHAAAAAVAAAARL
jgi:hypothetical protein